MSIDKIDLDDLKYAKILLENQSLAAKISNLLGTTIEKGIKYLPAKWNDLVQGATKKSLEKALKLCCQNNGRQDKAAFFK